MLLQSHTKILSIPHILNQFTNANNLSLLLPCHSTTVDYFQTFTPVFQLPTVLLLSLRYSFALPNLTNRSQIVHKS